MHPGNDPDLFDRLGVRVHSSVFWKVCESIPIRELGRMKYHPYYILAMKYDNNGRVKMKYTEMGNALQVTSVRAQQLVQQAIRFMVQPNIKQRYAVKEE